MLNGKGDYMDLTLCVCHITIANPITSIFYEKSGSSFDLKKLYG